MSLGGACSAGGLPQLRADLQVIGSDEGIVVFDLLRQKYFRLDETSAHILSEWPKAESAQALAAMVNQSFALDVTVAEIEELQAFLLQNQLATARGADSWRDLVRVRRASARGWIAWAVHNYLFLRVPLLRPQKALQWLAPCAAPAYTRGFAAFVAGAGGLGLYLVSRQWDTFLATFSDLMTLEGAVVFALAIGIVKSLHELGHAITAVRYGCRVPTMGICVIIGVPMLYTDVSDAWRLQNWRQRLAIDGAGLIVETMVACFATLAWAFLPDGSLRSMAFVLATTGWLFTVAINANPFMRFDGYYILSDLIGIENLQPRSFALGRWWLRECLFGLGRPPPEVLERNMRRWLIVYAWATWVYRLILFIGIALLVYEIGFKLLGIVLFLVEIVYFVLGPVWAEMKEWHKMRGAIVAARRGVVLCGLLGLGVLLALVPVSTNVRIPVVIEDSSLAQIFPPRAARIVEVHVKQGDYVAAGAPLLKLASPELERDVELTSLRLDLAAKRLARTAGDSADRADTLLLEQTLVGLRSKLAGLESEREELGLVAPLSGHLVEVPSELEPGRWLQRSEQVVLIAGGNGCTVRGYVSEDDIHRINVDRIATLVPEEVSAARRPVKLYSVSKVGSNSLDLAELTSQYGGSIAARSIARPGEARQIVSLAGQFLVSGAVVGEGGTALCSTDRRTRGMLHVSGRAESLAAWFWRRLLQVVIRESDF